jgi:deazaflavin-dependent oxidoreductase (nitroreductase family)
VTRLTAVATLVGVALLASAAAQPLPEIGETLDRLKDASRIEIATVGRKTGKVHTRPIWFVVSRGKILVQAGKDGKTDWYLNLIKTPLVTLRQGEYAFRARAVPVTDPARVEEIHRLFVEKYTSAWLLSLVGSSIGQGRPVELTVLAAAVSRQDEGATAGGGSSR